MEGDIKTNAYFLFFVLFCASFPCRGQEADTVKSFHYEEVYVQGGTFNMGCTPEQGNYCYKDENPVHPVTLKDFYIGKYEVTQAQWVEIMGANFSYYKGEPYSLQQPVEFVTWDEVQIFIKKLNNLTGKKYRLPTEAEWEYAARGGPESKGYRYSGGDRVEDVAWYYINSEYRPKEVGKKQPNELGLYDMSGNVWEWCSDWYGPYPAAARENPQGPDSGTTRVVRGGSWFGNARNVRYTFRKSYEPIIRSSSLGFRLARDTE